MSNGVAWSFVHISWRVKDTLQLHFDQTDWRLKEATAKLEVWKEWKPCSVTYYKWRATPYFTFPSGHTLGHFTEHHGREGTPTAPWDWPCHGVFSPSCWMRMENARWHTPCTQTHSLLGEMVSSAHSVFWRRRFKSMGTGLGLSSQRKSDSLSSHDITGYRRIQLHPINTTAPITCTSLCSPGQCSISS